MAINLRKTIKWTFISIISLVGILVIVALGLYIYQVNSMIKKTKFLVTEEVLIGPLANEALELKSCKNIVKIYLPKKLQELKDPENDYPEMCFYIEESSGKDVKGKSISLVIDEIWEIKNEGILILLREKKYFWPIKDDIKQLSQKIEAEPNYFLRYLMLYEFLDKQSFLSPYLNPFLVNLKLSVNALREHQLRFERRQGNFLLKSDSQYDFSNFQYTFITNDNKSITLRFENMSMPEINQILSKLGTDGFFINKELFLKNKKEKYQKELDEMKKIRSIPN
jgi:hypothetical protein